MAFRCEACGGKFGSQEELQAHGREEHAPAEEAAHTCAACGSVFASREELERHAEADHAG